MPERSVDRPATLAPARDSARDDYLPRPARMLARPEAAIKNKVSRGRFTFVFFLQAMAAIGVDWMQVPSVADLAQGRGIGDQGAQQLAKRTLTPNS